jgi:hypothetical protein
MENEGGQQGFGRWAGEASHFDVAETVEGEKRGPLLGFAATADIGVGGLGGAKVFAVYVSVRLEHLGKLQGNCLTASATDPEAAHS